jgi:beta-carotene 3-hydroxylase
MNIIIVVITFFLMEFVAWFTHKYVMHGFLWNLHDDHHNKNIEKFFEKNDSFFLIFALPSFVLILLGTLNHLDYRFWIGIGIAAYGLAYFFVHDIFIHRRFNYFKNSDNVYLRAIRKAHKVHHKHLSKEDGECFGMLLVPLKYFREAIKSRKA